MVIFEQEEKIKTKNLEDFLRKMDNSKIVEGILVYPKEISNNVKQTIEELKDSCIELFQEKELLVNITEHEYVPKHCPITDQEKRELLLK